MISVFRSVSAIWNGFLQSWFKMIKFFGWFLNLVRHLIPTEKLVICILNLFTHLFLTQCWFLWTHQILGVLLLFLNWQIIFLLQCFSLYQSQNKCFAPFLLFFFRLFLTFPFSVPKRKKMFSQQKDFYNENQ